MLPVLRPALRQPLERLLDSTGVAPSARRRARRVAEALGCRAAEIIFTSGGTESDNLALKGAALANRARGEHVVTTTVEHHAILHAADYLERLGFRVTRVPVDRSRRRRPRRARRGSRASGTTVVSVMHANNEVGTIQPIREVVHIVKERNPATMVHCDAVQSVGTLAVDVDDLGVDMLQPLGAQVLRAEGRRRALRPPRDALLAAAAGRRPGARTPGGHRERRRDRRSRDRAPPRRRRARGQRRARPTASRSARRGHPLARARGCPHRAPDRPSAEQRELCDRGRGGGVDPHRARPGRGSSPRPARPAPRPRSSRPTSSSRWASPLSCPTAA